MRVVAGAARGRRLEAPRGRGTRPTSDRVRESVFSMLTSRVRLEGADVLDLFAGTGAMGIEALSRGAASATFVERDPAALRALKANLASTGLGPATVIRADALRWAGAARRYDVAFLDPPYDFDRWPALLDVVPAGLVVVESRTPVTPGPRWDVVADRRYGSTVVRLLSESSALE